MPQPALAERRSKPRYPTDGLLVWVRKKGRLGHLEGLAQDFNRHGLAMLIDQPLPKDATVYVSLFNDEIKLDNVIGIVHNCTGLADGYRCGIQFRTYSELQLDKAPTERVLAILEARFKTLGGEKQSP
jgi:hypothetical protein